MGAPNPPRLVLRSCAKASVGSAECLPCTGLVPEKSPLRRWGLRVDAAPKTELTAPNAEPPSKADPALPPLADVKGENAPLCEA